MRLSPQFTWKESALIPHRSIPQRLACRLEGSRCLAHLSQLKGYPTPANPRRPPCWDGLPGALRQPSKGTRSNSVPQGVNRSSPTPKCEGTGQLKSALGSEQRKRTGRLKWRFEDQVPLSITLYSTTLFSCLSSFSKRLPGDRRRKALPWRPLQRESERSGI